jgi:uncharacterized protein YbjQ (UPF0145 family)
MILSTTPQIEGRPIREYKGVVTGEVIIGANVFKDFMAGLTDFFGGRSGSYEKVLIEAKDSSMQEMMQRAQALGANAIVGIDIFHRANTQNMQMIQGFVNGDEAVLKQVNQRAWQSAIVLIVLLLLIALMIWLLISFGSYLYSLLASIV